MNLKIENSNLFTEVDEDIPALLLRYNPTPRLYLNSAGYVHIRSIKLRKPVALHRIVMQNLRYANIDHIDRNKLNNKRNNLRFVSASFNLKRKTKQLNASSKFNGVFWHKASGNFRVQVSWNGINHYGGYFKLEEDARVKANSIILQVTNMPELCS